MSAAQAVGAESYAASVPGLAVAADAKRWATCQARAALFGVALVALQDDRGRSQFIATREALTRPFVSLDAVAAWLDQVEAGRGELQQMLERVSG